jgi:hypothetical protein
VAITKGEGMGSPKTWPDADAMPCHPAFDKQVSVDFLKSTAFIFQKHRQERQGHSAAAGRNQNEHRTLNIQRPTLNDRQRKELRAKITRS